MRHLLLFVVLFFLLGSTQAQVRVHEEPLHRPVYQNRLIRILNVQLPPGDTTQYHIHHTPSLFLFFTSTAISSQLLGATFTTSRSTASTILFENLMAPYERVHRVWNTDQDTFHVMDIELLSKKSGFIQKPLTLPHLQLMIDTPWARVYQLNLQGDSNFNFRNIKRPFVVVAMNTAIVQLRQGRKTAQHNLQPGSFFWIKPRQGFILKNKESAIARFALLEVPGQ
jgi:hypothetical protein